MPRTSLPLTDNVTSTWTDVTNSPWTTNVITDDSSSSSNWNALMLGVFVIAGVAGSLSQVVRVTSRHVHEKLR